ncbi:MAG: peptide chain release factor 1 [Nitrospinota bacterium]|nr:peptide chain release factor 1 [Nitrospinota bacterium]MDH5677407.1 peptide chain release factor 1 [Nitrospinota bacterium]MDH5756165.1 peptide chain release factor 1 [Nitrospinota bacterium]
MDSILGKFKDRSAEINRLLSDPATLADRERYEKLTRELAELRPVVTAALEYDKIEAELRETDALLADKDTSGELEEMALHERGLLRERLAEMEKKIRLLLIPKDPNDGKNIILEIRAGTGGDEASLFAADLFRMYSRYAERKKWKTEVMSFSESGKGGYKEVIAMISGKDAYSSMKYESGVHRVQRVPETEASGRIHTSTCTVAIMPEAKEVDVQLDPNEIRIDVYRSSGHGGQSVNTTDSAVRIIHLPTGLVVSMQDEKSQLKNKVKAMKVLITRIKDQKEREEAKIRAAHRKSQVGAGDRSERIRTYNFPQGRVTDHRINLTLYKMQSIMDGEIDEFSQALTFAAQEEAVSGRGAA